MKYAHSMRQQDPDREKAKRELIFDYLKQSDLEIAAVLDQCEMDLGDILRLQVNDVVALNRKISDDISVTVEGAPWYTARIGQTDTKKAVKLVDSLLQ